MRDPKLSLHILLHVLHLRNTPVLSAAHRRLDDCGFLTSCVLQNNLKIIISSSAIMLDSCYGMMTPCLISAKHGAAHDDQTFKGCDGSPGVFLNL